MLVIEAGACEGCQRIPLLLCLKLCLLKFCSSSALGILLPLFDTITLFDFRFYNRALFEGVQIVDLEMVRPYSHIFSRPYHPS